MSLKLDAMVAYPEPVAPLNRCANFRHFLISSQLHSDGFPLVFTEAENGTYGGSPPAEDDSEVENTSNDCSVVDMYRYAVHTSMSKVKCQNGPVKYGNEIIGGRFVK